MSTAASPAALPRSPSKRQQTAYASAAPERPHRAQSSAGRGAAGPPSPRRSLSSSQAPQSTHSRTPSANLQNVARKDFEQTNLARPQSSSRRSESRDRPMTGSNPTRADSMRNGNGQHTRTHSRYNSDAPTPAPAPPSTNGTASESRSSNAPSGGQNLRRRTTIDAETGSWELGKTIGAGSMGKVKLARNKETGEQVAVKIVPRQSTDEHRTQAERDRAEKSKEVRTQREASIVSLVEHPYICGMRDVVRTNYHWYMLFEYVNGGQMLDYIISHGRLKEKQARKFGRQIASALDYCHRNSIVHRDLKIENILISKTGDIKIIDFGLSNLFSPRSHLKTFCGSLYFAAPELLQAKQYTGPEVDVWSFGIVLYVLVCGKVPFDDQSMPQLHAKIKKGVVEYPPWLSAECKMLIARMLMTDPSQRATLTEIMNHPWICKGFADGPPKNFLPERKPVQLPLDPAVIEKMQGFDFGAADIITAQLTSIIESEEYQRAVRNAEKRNALATPELERKGRGVFDFYKRRNSTTSRDTLTGPSSEAIQLGSDPINAFNPLLSIYYLAREKIEREQKEKNPGALAMPQSPGEKPLALPDLPAPQAAYTNAAAYEMAGEKPTGGRSRPRARTHGEDEVTASLQGLNVSAAPSPTTNPVIVVQPQQDQAPPKKDYTPGGLLRRFSTRKDRKPSDRDREKTNHPPPSMGNLDGYGRSETPRKSFSVRRTRDRDPSASRPAALKPDTAQPRQQDLLTPPVANDVASDSSSKKSGGLGRSASVNSTDFRRRLTRRGVSEGTSMRPPMTSSGSSDRKPSMDQQGGSRDAASDVEQSAARGSAFASRTKSLGHARRESIQGRRSRRDATRTSNVPEETDQDIQEDLEGGNISSGSPNGMKPVYLKGLFSVSTTSNKPLSFIRADIIRVLRQLGVEFRDIKGGFTCRHSPSIDMSKVTDEAAPSGAMPLSPPATGHRRKISFGGFMGGEKDRDEFRDQQQQRQPPTPGSSRRRMPDRSYTNSDVSDEEENQRERKVASPRAAGETTTHVQSDLGESMVLKFEIFVVKVPLLSLHGIQFKKVDGGTWQYKNMAQTILNELRL